MNDLLFDENSKGGAMVPPFTFMRTDGLQISKDILRGNFVAYGSIGTESFYVQAETNDALDDKIQDLIRSHYKKSYSHSSMRRSMCRTWGKRLPCVIPMTPNNSDAERAH